MNKGRQIGVLVASGAAAVGMASVGLSAPGAAVSSAGPRPVSNWLRTVDANTSSLVAIGWQSTSRICDVRVRVDGGRQVDVRYPGFRNYTSLSRGTSLGAYRTDYSAIRVYPDVRR